MNAADKDATERRAAKELHADLSIQFDAAKAKLDALLNPTVKVESAHSEPPAEAQAERDGKKQVVRRLTGEIADLNNKIKSDERKLDALLNPRNEDEEPAETFEPVNDDVKAALAELERRIQSATVDEREELERMRRAIQNQNDAVAKLQRDKVQNAIDNKSRAVSNAEKKLRKLIDSLKPVANEIADSVAIEDERVLKALDTLDRETTELSEEDAKINEQAIEDKTKRRDKIFTTAKRIAELKARGDGLSEKLWAEFNGKSAAEKVQTRADISNTNQAIKDLQTQNNLVAALQAKVDRIKTAPPVETQPQGRIGTNENLQEIFSNAKAQPLEEVDNWDAQTISTQATV